MVYNGFYGTVCSEENDRRSGCRTGHEDLIRVSVGIEDIDDLKEDFAQAFANIAD